MRRQTLLLSCVFALLAGGCTATAPTTIGTHPEQDGGTQQQNTQPDMTPDPSIVHTPVLDAIAGTTVYMTLPIHGSSDPNTTVLIESMDGSTQSVDVDSSGRFCIDLPLAADKTNKFQLAAINTSGTESDIVTLAVRQQGEPSQSAAAPQAQNAALYGTAVVNRIGVFSSGAAGNVNDGDESTHIEGVYSNIAYISHQSSVVVSFAEAARINRIVVRAPADCPFTSPAVVAYSALAAPSAPDVQPSNWVNLNAIASDDNTVLTATLPSTIATNVSITWPSPSLTGNNNCGNFVIGPEYGVSELEAWTVPNQAPPPPAVPSCTGGY